MTKSNSALSLAALAAVLALLHPAHAQAATKIWVAWYGTDSAACGAPGSPCATFNQAFNNVAAGGEIAVLTPGDYGGLDINKSLTVSNDGVGEAGTIAGFFPCFVIINAGRGDTVTFRGLVLDGASANNCAIQSNSLHALHVQNCVMRNFAIDDYALQFIVSGGTSNLFLSDTVISNNGSTADSGGVLLQNQGGSINAVLDHVRLENNVIGLKDTSFSPGKVRATVRDSTVVGNAGDGILVTNCCSGLGAFFLVEHSTMVNNAGIGLHADGVHAIILLNDDTMTQNGTGISATNGGQLISYGNNKNNNNVGAEGAPTGFYSQM